MLLQINMREQIPTPASDLYNCVGQKEMHSVDTRSYLSLTSFPAKGCKIKTNDNRRSFLLFRSSFLRISSIDLPHRGKMHEALFVPFSIYRVWRSEDALFLALYDFIRQFFLWQNWDVLKVLSERTLQNMTKLTWGKKRVKSAFLGEKKHFF